MRWHTAVALVLFVVVSSTATIGAREPKPVMIETVDKPLDPEPILAPEPAPPASLQPSLPPSQRARDRGGVAQIKGRVTLAPGERDADGLSGLQVSADDGTRVFEGHITPGGHFAFHLPPGHYTLSASAAEGVGTAPDVVARAGEERDVDIRLGPGVAIRGALRAPQGAEVSVVAKVSSGSAETGTGTTDDGGFEITGLIPGRKYDLTFDGPKLRKTTLREIVAPTAGLEVALDMLAVVRGAVGFARGERCPIDEVGLELAGDRNPGTISGDNDEDTGLTDEPGADCRFAVTVPEGTFEATVVATGPGWFLEQHISIPAHGDPAPLCLNPPCRENPTEGLARLRVTLEGASADSGINVTASTLAGHRTSYQACSGEQSWCALEDLPAGETFRVEGYGYHCRAQAQTTVVVSGDNFIRLPCRRYRRVEGIIRIAAGSIPEALIVRCPGGGAQFMHETRVFEITCAAEDSDLEYQVDRGGPWRSIRLPSVSDPAFVEIAL